jgi:hypothetical protein
MYMFVCSINVKINKMSGIRHQTFELLDPYPGVKQSLLQKSLNIFHKIILQIAAFGIRIPTENGNAVPGSVYHEFGSTSLGRDGDLREGRGPQRGERDFVAVYHS